MNNTEHNAQAPKNRPSKKRIKIILIIAALILPVFLLIRFISPTWTPKINGSNSISELRSVSINGADLTVLIRGTNKDNPVLIFVHGGPCCSEIPYVRKYQDELEKDFTIVHYDQRGSGKSYKADKDYSTITAKTHVDDLIALTEYVEDYLNKDKVILLGHSFGTYIATQAAAQRPDLYEAYVGIGQMSDTIKSELNTLDKCIAAAEEKGIPVWKGGKISGAWLMDQSGLKGREFHGFKVWESAPLVLANVDAKSFADLKLARQEIRAIVQEKFGYTLNQEPVELGEED